MKFLLPRLYCLLVAAFFGAASVHAADNAQDQLRALQQQQAAAQQKLDGAVTNHRKALDNAVKREQGPKSASHSYSAQSLSLTGTVSLGAVKAYAANIANAVAAFKATMDNLAAAADRIPFGAGKQFARDCRNAGANAKATADQLMRIVNSARIGQRLTFNNQFGTLDVTVVN